MVFQAQPGMLLARNVPAGRSVAAAHSPVEAKSNAPWRRCQVELKLESQPSAQPELGSAEMLFGMLNTDSSWVPIEKTPFTPSRKTVF